MGIDRFEKSYATALKSPPNLTNSSLFRNQFEALTDIDEEEDKEDHLKEQSSDNSKSTPVTANSSSVQSPSLGQQEFILSKKRGEPLSRLEKLLSY